MLKYRVTLLLVCLALLPATAAGQFKKDVAAEGVTLGATSVQHWQCGVIVRAVSGPCKGVVATIPIPSDWPEQQVRVSKEDITRNVRSSEKTVDGVKNMVFTIATLPLGEEARAVITYEVTKRVVLPPKNTSPFKLPDSKTLDGPLRHFLTQGPMIESTNPKIKAVAKEVTAEKSTAWQKVEALYDYVRDKVKPNSRTKTKGAAEALKAGEGNHEDLAGLFIALCRAADVPARTVWVYQHCYPEFYLVDAEGKGFWFPCEMQGDKSFGGVSEQRPILQKGDNFRDPQKPRERMRFQPERLSGSGGSPDFDFVRRMGEQ